MDNNLPDDCQGRGKHLPWNEVREDECQVCGFPVDLSMEGGYEILICADDKCGHKVWADGDEY